MEMVNNFQLFACKVSFFSLVNYQININIYMKEIALFLYILLYIRPGIRDIRKGKEESMRSIIVEDSSMFEKF